MTVIKRAFQLAVTCALVAVLLPSHHHAASAHDGATYFPSTWGPGNGTQTWSFTTGFTTATGYRQRVVDAVSPWNSSNERIVFSQGSDIANFDPWTCPNPPRNGIHWRSDVGGALAVAPTCSVSGSIVSASIVVDSTDSWYAGTGTPAGTENDLLSVMTHEWGHATGFYGPFSNGHFGTDVCTSNATEPTMCPTITTGSTSKRSLESHDLHTFDAAYPPTWFLNNSNTGISAVTPFAFGIDGDIPIACDWNGDGVATIGVYRAPWFYLRDSNTSGAANSSFQYGGGGDTPVCGDWDGDGDDTIGIFRSSVNEWHLNNQNDSSGAEHSFAYGQAGDVPVVGNWDGSSGANADTIGIVRGNTWYLRNANSAGGHSITAFSYGQGGDIFVTGNWDGSTTNKTDTPGVYRSGTWYMNDSNDGGASEYSIAYGYSTDIPRTGNWDGTSTNKNDTPAVVRGA